MIISTGRTGRDERFADTSFFVAFLSLTDRHHPIAVRLMEETHEAIVTTAWVLVELGNWFRKSGSRDLFVLFARDIEYDPRIVVLPADEETFDAGFDLYSRRSDKNWSFGDCISFAVMHDRGNTDALTADHHFEQAGFRILLK